jgi:hypothetical protein
MRCELLEGTFNDDPIVPYEVTNSLSGQMPRLVVGFKLSLMKFAEGNRAEQSFSFDAILRFTAFDGRLSVSTSRTLQQKAPLDLETVFISSLQIFQLLEAVKSQRRGISSTRIEKTNRAGRSVKTHSDVLHDEDTFNSE